MTSSLALFAYFVVLLVLLRWSKNPKDSPALWLPVIWMFIISSKLPSQWLGLSPSSFVTTAFEEGSPIDRVVYLTLIILALWILTRRHLNWREIFARNSALILLLAFGLVSVTWSDFPFVSFKRWIRDLGQYGMVLIVVSDTDPRMAITTVLRRFSHIMLLLSLVLIKYYPWIGVLYNPWSGAPEYVGATTSKNQLGVLCLVTGLFYFWDTLRLWPERKGRGVKRVLFANIIFIGIMLRLLRLSSSATSLGCLVMGCLIIVILHSNWPKANPRFVTAAIPVLLAAYVVLEFGFNLSGTVAGFLGRDPTLTGRTHIWATLLAAQTNPLLGVGYQSFWMGDRMAAVLRSLNTGFLNEAHNGYLETYLNIGVIGLVLLVVFLFSGGRTVCRQIVTSPHFASLGITLWMVNLFYNFTEAAFGSSILWAVLLLSVVVVPRSDEVASRGTEFVVKRRTATLQRYGSRQANGGILPRRTGIRDSTSPSNL